MAAHGAMTPRGSLTVLVGFALAVFKRLLVNLNNYAKYVLLFE